MSLVIMAHPQRRHLAAPLARQLGASQVVYDPGFGDGDYLPHRDTLIDPNPLRCARWAWRAAAEIGPWACVVQDDAVPLAGVDREMIERVWLDAQERYGACAVSLYQGSQSATGQRLAAREQPGFVPRQLADTYLATVAAIVPSPWVSEWLAFSRRPYWSKNHRDDECWGAFLSQEERLSYACRPCLFDHDNDTPSVAGNEQHGARRAAVTPPPGATPWSL